VLFVAVESFEELQLLERDYRLIGVRVHRPDGNVEWLDPKLRPIPGEPKEIAEKGLRGHALMGPTIHGLTLD